VQDLAGREQRFPKDRMLEIVIADLYPFVCKSGPADSVWNAPKQAAMLIQPSKKHPSLCRGVSAVESVVLSLAGAVTVLRLVV
jgi:hypothetical protein